MGKEEEGKEGRRGHACWFALQIVFSHCQHGLPFQIMEPQQMGRQNQLHFCSDGIQKILYLQVLEQQISQYLRCLLG